MDIKQARRKYHGQKNNARKRGIGWELTFQQWLDWWGEDLDKRGKKAWQLQMQRIGDVGPYRLDNIRKGVPKQNGRTYSTALQNRKSEAARREHQMAVDAIEPEADEVGLEDESISSYMSRDPDRPSGYGCKWDRIHRS